MENGNVILVIMTPFWFRLGILEGFPGNRLGTSQQLARNGMFRE